MPAAHMIMHKQNQEFPFVKVIDLVSHNIRTGLMHESIIINLHITEAASLAQEYI